jgi:hypothetical protein
VTALEPRLPSFLAPPRPLRLRRLAVLRVLAHPLAAARALDHLADESDQYRRAVGSVIRACASTHQPRR